MKFVVVEVSCLHEEHLASEAAALAVEDSFGIRIGDIDFSYDSRRIYCERRERFLPASRAVGEEGEACRSSTGCGLGTGKSSDAVRSSNGRTLFAPASAHHPPL
jgi:hypothetical protein